ncbi:hypothetical protein EJ02DRAFT_473841 [Clathrospora elynae]|uniref:Rhodopsin domain-containing protein n=1 Tax=Clathrospora elynae TaxID=706981 RepID=A0A6A5T0X7_9PLEO|nr:hypothetical protein EJ02DRAFT_473841 [Clathrospora elynae]
MLRQEKSLLPFGSVMVDTSKLDFNDHSSRVASVKITNTVFIILVVLTVGLRIFARARYVHKIFADDVLVIFATVFTVGLGVTSIAATSHGLGQHVWDVDSQTVFQTTKTCILYLYVCQVLYAFAIALTKIAIISSYLRFIKDGKFRIAMYITSVFIAGLWVTGVFVTIFQCRPVAGGWDFLLPRKCIDYFGYLYASSAVNVATDVVLCSLPLPHLWRLNMPLKQRLILCVLFAGGASACIVAIFRIGYLYTLRVMDTTYQSVPCLLMSIGESSLGIIAISIPPLRPLAKRLFPSGMRSSPSSATQHRTWHAPLNSIPTTQNGTNFSTMNKRSVVSDESSWQPTG